MLTFNDLEEILKSNSEKEKMEFVLKAIKEHKDTTDYKIAKDAEL